MSFLLLQPAIHPSLPPILLHLCLSLSVIIPLHPLYPSPPVISVLSPFPPPPLIFPLTSLVSLEGQRLRGGSLSLAVEYGDGQGIVGVWSEITDHLLLLVGPSLHHHSALWLPGPTASVMAPGADSGQVDLEPQNQSEK